MRKNVFLASAASGLLLGVLLVRQLRGQSSPISHALFASVSPETAVINRETAATIIVPIPSSSSLPLNINLLRVEASGGSTIIGVLKDDGLIGDVTASDRVYTALLVINEPQAQTLRLQVSAAFRGQIKRVLSNVIQIAVSTRLIILPADPGEAGKQTLPGIDSDNDGVRDDIQRWIVFRYPGSERSRAALLQYSRSMIHILGSSHDPILNRTFMLDIDRATRCARELGLHNTGSTVIDQLESEYLNTLARSRAWIKSSANSSGQVVVSQERGQGDCDFNAAQMAN